MRNSGSLWIVALVMLLLDLYVFWVIRFVSHSLSERSRAIVFTLYWVVSILAIVALLTFPYWREQMSAKHIAEYVFALVLGLVFAKLLATVFFLADDLRRGALWVWTKISGGSAAESGETDGITRSAFLSWLGLLTGGTLLGSLVYGFSNKYDYTVNHVKLPFSKLPPAFKGFKIVQISDVHSGSFSDKEAVNRGVELVLQQQPDLILFTGDLVNDRAVEMKDYTDVFSRLQAPHGVYSTLGNHDYGDYYWGANPQGEAAIEKANNLEQLKQLQAGMGWRMLMNEHVPIEKDGQAFALIGIENWSAKANFPKYGDMSKAYAGAEKYPFKILMSHDPSHWDAQVRTQYSDIDLTLSGHTHGMQFGIETPWFKWSPVQWMYQQWAGLYQAGSQYLYVNRGYGFIGYPGRVGILPEITVFELA